MYMYIGDYERLMFQIDPNLKHLRDLKNQYINFNNTPFDDFKALKKGFDKIILLYKNSKYRMFNEVADSLETHYDEIINSFVLVEKLTSDGPCERRLSNGPIEALNRIPKDMKRHGRGYLNFDHIRNRFLFSQRKNASILGVPRSVEDVHIYTGKKRGSYQKKE